MVKETYRRGNGKMKGKGVVATQGKASTWTSIGSGYLFAPNTINPLWRDVASSLFVELTGNCHRSTVPRRCHASDLIYNRFAFYFQPFHFVTRRPPESLRYLYFHQCDPLHSTRWLNKTREENRRFYFCKRSIKKKTRSIMSIFRWNFKKRSENARFAVSRNLLFR